MTETVLISGTSEYVFSFCKTLYDRSAEQKSSWYDVENNNNFPKI